MRAGPRSVTAGRLVACAGLQSDRLASLAGLPVTHQIVPFRGEYYRLPSEKNGIVRSLIYHFLARRIKVVTPGAAPNRDPRLVDLDQTDWRER